LFTGDDISKPVAALSGGEQSRLALAKLIYTGANVLVMDEPTNHLDIPSREALEQALAEFTGTIITVSHDRYFLDKLATEILHFEDGVATYHTGTYTDFYAVHHLKQTVKEEPPPKKRPALTRSKSGAGSSAKQRRRPLEEIEQEIKTLENELADLSERLCNASSDWRPEQYAEISGKQDEISSLVEALYREWQIAAIESD
jgi:ATP-binding cassette subfamily F protein 3